MELLKKVKADVVHLDMSLGRLPLKNYLLLAFLRHVFPAGLERTCSGFFRSYGNSLLTSSAATILKSSPSGKKASPLESPSYSVAPTP